MTFRALLHLVVPCSLVAIACSSGEEDPPSGTGGQIASGGASTGSGGTTWGTGGDVAMAGAFSSGGAAAGGSATGGAGTGTGGVPIELDAQISIDTTTRHQTVDGFGAALPMWVGSANGMLTVDEVRRLVGTGDGELGLSILRTVITPATGPWAYAVSNLKEAKAYGQGVQILATPWSPPAHMKSNNSTTSGGKLLTAYYGAYAAHLNSYVDYMTDQGVEIDVVSVQNEPDYHPEYESCDWTGNELRNFVRDHGSSIGAKLLLGESLRFDRAYTDPTLNDPVAVNNVDLIGGHLYSAESYGFFTAYPLAEQRSKGLWMTEWLTHEADGSGAPIWGGDNQAVWDETLDVVLRSVHISMQINWNAYIWWWARRFYSFIGDGESQYGTQAGQILKRGWAFSHYSKFIRPGYERVSADTDGSFSFLNLTAYAGDDRIVAVMLNRSNDQYDDVVIEVPHQVTSAEAYVTSRSENRRALEVIPQSRYAIVSSIAPRSVVTVVISH